MGVDLSCLDVGMPEHILDDIDVGTHFELERSIRMPEAMEGDVLLDASRLNPFLQWFGNPCGSLKPGKDQQVVIIRSATTHGKGLFRDG